MGRMIALAAALTGALLLAWTGTRTPDPARGPSAPTAFSTEKALADIGQIARAPHPGGSAANARVRDYLTARMTALGLEPALQSGFGVETRPYRGATWVVGGQVENIVGVLPGLDRDKPALALMAHYDSVPASPGAADDATGVAVVLDVVRALKARGPPRRDVIVILTDGEEAGLLGARVFFRDHPLRSRIGLLINLESRGGGGRANMFQTGPDNGELISTFARTAVRPISNALAVFLYENMPNDTDFTVSNAAGVRGLNYAFVGRQFDYHSPTSTLANLDKGSVRHMGDQALAAAADLAFADALPGKSPDAVYSQTFGDHVLAYPAGGGWIVLLIAAGLITLAATRARRAGGLSLIDTARGAGAALFLLIAGALLLHLARKATGVGFGFMEQRPLLAQWGLWETTLALMGVGLLLLVPVLQARGGARWALAATALVAGLLCSVFGG
ncbi:MAG: M20/M25/M40 family metallo-hydrolase [Caulobacter sp.]|nr:M20/M25/M40 family metallo-hydrolase [Caulobacter sp.]